MTLQAAIKSGKWFRLPGSPYVSQYVWRVDGMCGALERSFANDPLGFEWRYEGIGHTNDLLSEEWELVP